MKHNVEMNGIMYKYDLPVENKPLEFINMRQLVSMEAQMSTPTLNLYDVLELDKNSSYE